MSTDFPKSARLLNPKQYKFVFDKARYKVADRYSLILARPCSELPPSLSDHHPINDTLPVGLSNSRLGIVVAKRHVKRAVDRNRFKRMARETYRGKRSNLDDLHIVILAKAGAGNISKEQLRQSFEGLWTKLSSRIS